MLDLLWYVAGRDENPDYRVRQCDRAGFVVVSGSNRSPDAHAVLVTKCDGLILVGTEVGLEARELFFQFRNEKKHIVNGIGLDEDMLHDQLVQWRQEYERQAIQRVLASAAATTSSRD